MQVIFTRLDSRRYAVGLRRDGPRDIGVVDVPSWPGPGSAKVPHDLVHFVVEEQLGLRLGIFGQAAAGGGVRAFKVGVVDRSGVTRHRSERLRLAGRSDMQRSEQVTACVGPDGTLSAAADALIGDPRTAAALRLRLEQALAAWFRVGVGRSLTLTWPSELTLLHARPPVQRRGRRSGGLRPITRIG
jgi:hypothetical protein